MGTLFATQVARATADAFAREVESIRKGTFHGNQYVTVDSDSAPPNVNDRMEAVLAKPEAIDSKPAATAMQRASNFETKAMTPTQYDAHIEYTEGGAYEGINSGLRGQYDMSPGQAKIAEGLSDAIAHGSQLASDTTVYRGVGGSIDDLKKGSVLADPAFLSTSVSPKWAQTFAEEAQGERYVLHITAPAGTRYLVGNVGEREVLFNRNTALVVDKIDTSGPTPIVHAHMKAG